MKPIRQLKGNRAVIAMLVAMQVICASVALGAIAPASAGAATVASNPYNHSVALGLRSRVAVLPRGIRTLSPATRREVAQATVRMTAADQTDFTTLVQAAQAEIRQGLSVGVRQLVTTALAGYGLPQPANFATLDPVELVTLPVATQVAAAGTGNTRQVGETASVARPNVVDGPPAPSQHGSTNPALSETWSDVLGARLATVSYVKSWSWDGTSVTSAPRYMPPVASFTSLCIGCSFNVTWHDEYWYPYNGGNSHSGYANKVQFTIHQCYGFWLLNQCLADKNENWSLRLHNNGTYSAYYN